MTTFVLCAGRCGSTTFAQACRHMTNYTAGHETRSHLVGPARLAYPADHIEADNRLAWLLGRLELTYGDRAAYVHLTRDRLATARSFRARYGSGIIGAYQSAILMGLPAAADPLEVCLDYVDTVTANVAAYLRDKTRVFRVQLETAAADFARFWYGIGAEGDLEAARAEWTIRHNATPC